MSAGLRRFFKAIAADRHVEDVKAANEAACKGDETAIFYIDQNLVHKAPDSEAEPEVAPAGLIFA